MDGRRQHEVHPVQIEFGAHLVVDLAGGWLLQFHHLVRHVLTDEGEMGATTRALAGDRGQIRLCGQPFHDRCSGIGFAVEIDMDERRAHDATDVIVSSGTEIPGQKIRGDVGGDVVAPTLEQRLFAALLRVAAVRAQQRVNGPTKRGGVELRGGEAVEGVDVRWNGGDHGSVLGKWKSSALWETKTPLGQSLRCSPASVRTRERAT